MMKKIFILLLVLFAFDVSYAQTLSNAEINELEVSVRDKARKLCEYIVKVGTSPGQEGSVSSSLKQEIVDKKVPKLFYDYDKRYMLTTKRNGTVTKRQRMYTYFSNLKKQSEENKINVARKYELSYSGIINKKSNYKGWYYLGKLSDGCLLYMAVIRIKQIYHLIDLNASKKENRIVEKSKTDEVTTKEFKVYALEKPDGTYGIFLGDVTRAYDTK